MLSTTGYNTKCYRKPINLFGSSIYVQILSKTSKWHNTANPQPPQNTAVSYKYANKPEEVGENRAQIFTRQWHNQTVDAQWTAVINPEGVD